LNNAWKQDFAEFRLILTFYDVGIYPIKWLLVRASAL